MHTGFRLAPLLLILQLCATVRAQFFFPPFFGNGGDATTTTAAAPAPTYSDVYCNVQYGDGSVGNNRGIRYAYYDVNPYYNSVPVSNGTNGYPNYDPTFWDTQTPFYIGQTPYIGFNKIDDTRDPQQYYADSPPHTIENTTLVHRGYLYARTTGTYTFINSYVDDIVLTWVNSQATSGYTRSNADLVDTYSTPPQDSRYFTINLQAGTYLPFRVQWSNAQGSAALTYSILDPNGDTLLDMQGSADIVTKPCSSSSATVSATFTPFYRGNYVTVTYIATGTATFESLTTIKTASGSATGTVDLYLPQYTATGTASCSLPSQTLSSDGTGNSGLQYGYWNYSAPSNTNVGNNGNTQSSLTTTYDPSFFDDIAAVHLGISNRIGCNFNGDSSIYSDISQQFDSEDFSLIQRGYLWCQVSGVYTFNLPTCTTGDYSAIWVGDTAISGFQSSNANCLSSGDPASYQHYCNAGQYLPVRIQYGHGSGQASFQSTIIDPNGNQLLDQNHAQNIFFQSCPGATSNDGNTTDGSNPTGAGSQNPIPTFNRWFSNSTTYTTITTQNPGTDMTTVTSTLASPSGTVAGTIEILTPGAYNTITGPYTGPNPITGPFTSIIALPQGTTPGTVEVFTPAVYVTTTAYYQGPGTLYVPSTTTLAGPSGTTPGSVEVFIPASYVTLTSLNPDLTNTNPVTTTIAQASGTNPGTIEILTPAVYTTVTVLNPDRANPSPSTITLAQPSGTNAGTVEVLTPAVYTTITAVNPDPANPSTSTITLAQPSGSNRGTVEILTPAPYTTITVPYTGNGTFPGPSTTTIAAPQGTSPGTVEVIIPAVYQTTTEAYSGMDDLTMPFTITAVQPSGNMPGVVIVITPTITRTASSTMSRPTLATMLGPASCLCLPA